MHDPVLPDVAGRGAGGWVRAGDLVRSVGILEAGPVTVPLSRAAGPHPKAKEWALAFLPQGRVVLFGCPFCASTGIIGPPVPVTADGAVLSLVSCSSGSCDFAFQVFLQGWTTPRVESLCQADGGVV